MIGLIKLWLSLTGWSLSKPFWGGKYIMNDSSHSSLQAIRYPTELELAAYNEVGHAVVGVIQGRYIEYIMLKQEGERWGGETKQDMFSRHHIMLVLPPRTLYAKIGNYPFPQGGDPFKPVENCILKYAGVVAEELFCEQLRVNSSEVRIGQYDITEAEEWAGIAFPDDPEKQQTLLHNAKALAYVILRDPDCWHAVENLTRAIVEEYTEGSAMRGERAHEIINQAFIKKQDLGL